MTYIRNIAKEPASWCVIVFLALVSLWFNFSYALSAEKDYRVESHGNLIQVTTPFGNKVYFLDSCLSRIQSYRFEIPISDFKPRPSDATSSEKNPTQLDNTDQIILKANELYNRGKFNESLAFIAELLTRDPKHVRGWIMKGSLMHALGQKDLAKKAWQNALELEPNNSQIKTILGRYE